MSVDDVTGTVDRYAMLPAYSERSNSHLTLCSDIKPIYRLYITDRHSIYACQVGFDFDPLAKLASAL